MAEKELTRRQVEVARLLLAGKSEYQIARALGVKESTIRDHLRALTKKLDGAEGHGGIINALWIEHTIWRAGPFAAIIPPDDCPLNGRCPGLDPRESRAKGS